MNQLTLKLSNGPAGVTPEDIARMENILAQNGWLTARDMASVLNWTDRKIRAVASKSDQVISWPGSPGYKLIGDCTRDEYERFRNANRSQAREMIARVVRADRVFFGRITSTQ